jgi:hypothetical protein
MVYTLLTVDGNQFVFDVRTGSIISDSRKARQELLGWPWIMVGVAVAAVTLFLLCRWAWRRKRKPEHVQPM